MAMQLAENRGVSADDAQTTAGDTASADFASFLDYRIPTCPDVPRIDAVIMEAPNPGHPCRVRGAGEMSSVPPGAAIANAIHAAVGVRLGVLPRSSRRILEAL